MRTDAREVAAPAAAPETRRLPSLSAFFPVRDEEGNVVEMARALLAALPQVAERWELIIVDDGSRDGTAALADDLARRHADVWVVRHGRGLGYGAAIRSGIAAARYEYVFLTDGDRQFDPAQIRLLIAEIGRADAVVGYRRRRADPLGRRVMGRLWNAVVRRLVGVRARDVNCAFKLFRARALAGIALHAEGAVISAELLAHLGRRGAAIVEVPVEHLPRRTGRASGASWRVIARAGAELLELRRLLRAAPDPGERRAPPGDPPASMLTPEGSRE
jgi:glycosyltransferase involved in cell wall biosynthesis